MPLEEILACQGKFDAGEKFKNDTMTRCNTLNNELDNLVIISDC